MAKVGAQRAAELTGKSKSTVQRSMNSGKLSFELDQNGRRLVDVSELERVFGLKQTAAANNGAAVEKELEKASGMIEMERLKMRIKMLEDQLHNAESQIEDLKDQRDSWQKQASQVLLTSQYTQKQAEDLAEKLKVREQRARERKQQAMDRQMQQMRAENQNRSDSMDFDSAPARFWKKITGAAA